VAFASIQISGGDWIVSLGKGQEHNMGIDMDSGRRRHRMVLPLGALALVLVTSPWWLGGARDAMRRAMLMTTADPDVLRLVATASMNPMTVTLHTNRPETIVVSGPMGERTDRTGRIVDERVVFKAPAAYFSVLDLKEGPAGPQRVGFSVWSSKFDPARPYLLEALNQDGNRAADPNVRPRSIVEGTRLANMFSISSCRTTIDRTRQSDNVF
jgi:hypothetical protein